MTNKITNFVMTDNFPKTQFDFFDVLKIYQSFFLIFNDTLYYWPFQIWLLERVWFFKEKQINNHYKDLSPN